jgi:outer membrane protein W
MATEIAQFPSQTFGNESSKKSRKALDSLIGIALALPGISRVQAQQTTSTSPQADAGYSRYSENKNHYKIDTYETSLLFLVSPTFEVGLSAVRDLMTGASPFGYLPNIITSASTRGSIIPGTSVDPAFLLTEVSTGQSIIDTRNQVEGLVNYYLPDGKVALNTGYSTEVDYESFYENLNTEWYFNKKNTIVYAGVGVAYNITRPQAINFQTRKGKSNTETLFLAVKQDVNKNFYIQQNAELIFDNGFLSDPYKIIAFNGPNILNWPGAVPRRDNIFVGYEQRPNRRMTGAFVTNLVHYITCFDSALHFTYRYAANSWNIHSNTFELGYYQPFLESWEIAPKVRYYTQDSASFYALSYHTKSTPLFLHSKPLRRHKASSDYRLASFGSIGYDITLSKKFQNPSIKLSTTFGFTKRATNFSWTKSKLPKNPSNQFHSKYVAVQLTSDFPQKLSFKKAEKRDYPYQKGDISIQPLMVSFAGMTFGRKHYDTKFTTSTVAKRSMYRNMRGLGLNDIHRNGIGYDFQAGYFPLDCTELFADLGFIYEGRLKKPTVVNALAFRFKERTTYRTNLGARYYFDTKTIFTPFVGFMGGIEWQPKTKSDVYTGASPLGQKIGRFKIFKAQNLFNGAFLAGMDYRFDKTYAVSFQTGLYYYQRNKAANIAIPGQQKQKISDYKNKVIVPVSISLKIIL